jgi:hypothetical protein
MDEDLGAPDMPQKFQSQSDSLGGAADQPRYVRHDKDLALDTTHLDDPQDRFQRREGIVRNLGSSG